MVAQSRRPYRSTLRADRAGQTRARVIGAAARLFAKQGYAATSVRAIATEAGVSLERVTAAGTKAELLLDAFRQEFRPAEGSVTARLDLSAPDPEEALATAARAIVRDIGASLGIWRALTTAGTDPKVATARAELVTQRRAELTEVVRAAERAGIAPERTSPQRRVAADAIGLLVSHEAYEQLVVLCGWAEAEYADWIVRAVLRELAAPA